MASITFHTLDRRVADPWADVVRITMQWADERAVALRDAVVLVPFAQHLPLARQAWAGRGSWLPRIETTQTLARALGPPEAPGPAPIRFEGALDRLTARRLLRGQRWAAAWARRDARGFEQAVAALVALAQAFSRAAAALMPAVRNDHWSRARAVLSGSTGPGATERALAGVALEWAAASGGSSTDALFALQPSAWIVVQAGGADALARSLLDAAGERIPCLLLDSDADIAAPFAGAPAHVEVATCVDFEDEAQCTAAHLLNALAAGLRPVALIAQDRLLVRRVRALLARQAVPVQDETGWRLSTTRAGAGVAALLRSARRDATCDDLLDWLKGIVGEWPGVAASGPATEALESLLRRRGWSHPSAVEAAALGPAPARLWNAAQSILVRVRSARSQPLGAWLALLADALQACGAMASLRDDDAGRQVLEALHVDVALGAPFAIGGDEPLDLDDFAGWVDGALEEALFRPEAPADPAVVITPLERAPLRPFPAIVLAGADEKRLGALPAPQPLLGDALAARLGLPDVGARRDRETLAFAQLLRAPRVVLLRREDDGGEPLAPSPLLERLEIARLRDGAGGLDLAVDPRRIVSVEAAPIEHPLPRLAGRLPERLSASACEALRTCPYRFHALYGLGLREADELDDEIEKRDYGTWLHDVLHRFHSGRSPMVDAAEDSARLRVIADAVRTEMHLDEAAFLPFQASFDGFVPRYVAWLREREAAGARWLDGEREVTVQPPAWGGTAMRGRLDRIDVLADAALQLIDYKTGSAEELIRKVHDPLEDTQLAFYAALVGAQAEQAGESVALQAAYLTLDERERVRLIEHEDVQASADRLLEGIGAELARIRAGAPLPALGEGRACTYCEARGLCRRDHWPAAEARG
jgi:ATP-dependent helicase/nuclease subunit B